MFFDYIMLTCTFYQIVKNSQNVNFKRLHSMTLEIKLHYRKNLHLYHVSIHIDFHQTQSINECARNNFLKYRSYVKTELCKDGVFCCEL